MCVGDVHAIGTARLQACQPRQPCFKLALYFADASLPKAMVRTGRAGWYYRVIDEGTIRAGGLMTLVDRPNPGFGLERLIGIFNHGGASRSELAAMAKMPGLASALQARARAALG